MIFGIERWPDDQPALRSDDGMLMTYGDVRREIEHIGSCLHDRSLIFCMCKNVPASVCGYLAFLEHSCVPLLLPGNLDAEQLDNLIRLYTPAYIWADVANSSIGPDSSSHASGDSENLIERIFKNKPFIISGNYGLYPTGYDRIPMHEDLALLLSTSGSTGSPKLIRLSRENIESNARSIAEYLELNSSELPVTTLPMQYTFGLSVINSHLSVGACILMTDKSVVQQGLWDLVRTYRATSISGVPYTYEILHRIHFLTRDDIGSLTSMIQAGGHLPVELQEIYGRWCMEHGVRFYVMYGQTEATARMSYLPWKDVLRKINSIGIAIPGGRFELQDTDGSLIEEPDMPGELVYYGPNVSLGYAASPEDLVKPDENHGVLHTGDLASVDSEGYYTIRGRLGRFIKIYGIRVGLDECENILKGLDVDGEFACVGTDDRLTIFTDSSRHAEAAEYLSNKLKLNIRAFSTVYLSEIPVKDTGKKDYNAMKSLITV